MQILPIFYVHNGMYIDDSRSMNTTAGLGLGLGLGLAAIPYFSPGLLPPGRNPPRLIGRIYKLCYSNVHHASIVK